MLVVKCNKINKAQRQNLRFLPNDGYKLQGTLYYSNTVTATSFDPHQAIFRLDTNIRKKTQKIRINLLLIISQLVLRNSHVKNARLVSGSQPFGIEIFNSCGKSQLGRTHTTGIYIFPFR
jgi:hypothetical protein